MEITKMLTLSTAHIKESTSFFLTDASFTQHCPNFVVFNKGEYGFWVYIPDDFMQDDTFTGPEDLLACMQLAKENDCIWLCLDRDGPEEPELPTYEWA